MENRFSYENIFNPEGKLLQVEYALEALNSSTPMIVVKNNNKVFVVSKNEKDKLLDIHTNPHIFNVNDTVYGAITGFPGDIDIVKRLIIETSASFLRSMGTQPTAKIISIHFAHKIQEIIQGGGLRAYCFGLVLFSAVKETTLYYTDTSAICYPYIGIGVGKFADRMNKELEKSLFNANDNELEEIILESMGHSLGNQFTANDVTVGVLEMNQKLRILSYDEVDAILTRVSEKN